MVQKMSKDPFKLLIAASISIVSLSAIVLTGIAVIEGFNNTGLLPNNVAALAFIVGLGIFGSFAAVVVLALIGKVIQQIFTQPLGKFDDPFKLLGGAAIALTTMAATVITGIAVAAGFKDTGLVSNTVADNFIIGLGVFAAFAGVMVLAVMGKVIQAIFTNKV